MIHYIHYSAEEFAMDADFQQWIQHPDPDADQLWQYWLAQHPEKWEVVQEARQLVLLANVRNDQPTQQDESEVWARIQASRRNRPPVKLIKPKSPVGRRLFAWVAVVAGFALLGSMLYLLNFQDKIYQTEYGQMLEIALPDGSRVVLNAHSSLKVMPDWQEGRTREVWLEGEAFFNVKKKAQPTPFIVHTQDLNVEVLGTQFNVACRTNNQSHHQSRTQVVLNTGKVKLTPGQQGLQSVVMEPGDLVELNARQSKLSKRKVNPALYSSWVNQEWMLENTSLQEVKERLEQTFGLKVHFVSPDIARERMSGRVSTENLDELLDALSTINDLKIRREGQQILISR